MAIKGWTQTSALDFLDLAEKFDRPQVAAIVFTDISRDGMQTGFNWESTRLLCQSVSRPVIAAGGVHDLNDVKKAMSLAPLGLAGIITGRAIYEGTLDLGEALKLVAG